MIKGVIFDLDGTLIDSMGVWYGIDREFLRENGVDSPPDDISDRMKKMTIDESSEYFIKEFGLNCTKEYVIQRIEELVRKAYEEIIELKPYTREFLDYLDKKGIPYGIATATYKSLAEAVLKRHGICERFAFILTDREYPKGKNFPDIFIGGAERFGALPNEVMVIEDSLHCIKTSKNAGFYTVGIYDSAAEDDVEQIKNTADEYFGSFLKLMEYMNDNELTGIDI